MHTIKGCLFDLDGVIVDTAKYHFKAWRRLANELGFDFTEEDNEHLKGVSRMESLELILKMGNHSMSEADKEAWAIKKNDWYLEYVANMDASEILPGVVDFLNGLKARQIKIGLGSASKNAPGILRQIGLYDYFDVIIDGNQTTKGKPDPQVFLMGSEALGLQPQECIVFEDAPKGAEAAKRGGFYCIGIGTPQSLPFADETIASFAEISANDVLSVKA
jgi:beta-phosphoglucomutase